MIHILSLTLSDSHLRNYLYLSLSSHLIYCCIGLNGAGKLSTPLLEYIRQRKQERIRLREDRREEKRRKDMERRRLREEERRRKKVSFWQANVIFFFQKIELHKA